MVTRDAASFAGFTGLALASSMLAGAEPAAADLLQNPSFEVPGPLGPSTSFTGVGPAGPSAAADWTLFNTVFSTITTELLPSTLPGDNGKMIHVTTNGRESGLEQELAIGAGPAVMEAAFVFVLGGQVCLEDATTNLSSCSTSTAKWELLEALSTAPTTTVRIFSSPGGGADFYVDEASASVVPEPGTWLLVPTAVGLAWLARKKRGLPALSLGVLTALALLRWNRD